MASDNPQLEAIKSLLSSMGKSQDNLFLGFTKSQEITNKKLTELQIEVGKLLQTVCGDEEYGQQGLVEKVNLLNKDMEKQKLSSAKIIGGLAVIGVIWTMLLKAIKF